MDGNSVEPADLGAMADFTREAFLVLGISEDQLSLMLVAAQVLSDEEFKIIEAQYEFARAGIGLQRRSAIARGIVNALRTLQVA
jgi:hypothetical protein